MGEATVGTMLDYAGEFENTLNAFLADFRDRAKDDTVRLLAYYLARFKKHLPDTIGIFTLEQYEQIRRTPLKDLSSKFISQRCFDDKYLSSNASAPELLETAAELTDNLLCFYQWLVHQPAIPGAQGFLQSLVVAEEKGLEKIKELKEQPKFRS